MKYKYIILVGILSVALFILGWFFKIESFPYASEIIGLSACLGLISLLLYAIKVFKDPKYNR